MLERKVLHTQKKGKTVDKSQLKKKKRKKKSATEMQTKIITKGNKLVDLSCPQEINGAFLQQYYRTIMHDKNKHYEIADQ